MQNACLTFKTANASLSEAGDPLERCDNGPEYTAANTMKYPAESDGVLRIFHPNERVKNPW